ncbi:hypothetical protein ES703_94571 [subsurface metagenome]
MYDIIKKQFIKLVNEKGLQSEKIVIHATPLSPQQAIGNPEDKDYPLITGAERLMQAEFRGSLGHRYHHSLSDSIISDVPFL